MFNKLSLNSALVQQSNKYIKKSSLGRRCLSINGLNKKNNNRSISTLEYGRGVLQQSYHLKRDIIFGSNGFTKKFHDSCVQVRYKPFIVPYLITSIIVYFSGS